MKKEISPVVAVIAIAIILAVIVAVFWRQTQPKEVRQPRMTAPPMRVD